MPPKASETDDWSRFLLLCLQNVRDGEGRLIVPNFDTVARIMNQKRHTVYVRYNEHVRKPIDAITVKAKKGSRAGLSTPKMKRKTTEAEDDDGEPEEIIPKPKRAKKKVMKEEPSPKEEEKEEAGGEDEEGMEMWVGSNEDAEYESDEEGYAGFTV